MRLVRLNDSKPIEVPNSLISKFSKGKRFFDSTFLLTLQAAFWLCMGLAWKVSVGVHRERAMEDVSFVELLAAPSAKRRWSDEAKGRRVAKTLAIGGTVTEWGAAGNCLRALA